MKRVAGRPGKNRQVFNLRAVFIFLMHMKKAKGRGRALFFSLVMAMVLVWGVPPIPGGGSPVGAPASLGDNTYYNATVVIVSHVYRVSSSSEESIVLEGYRLPYLPSLLYIADESGVQELGRGTGPNSRVTITGLQGFFRDWLGDIWGLYVVVWGTCHSIRVQTFR